MIQKKRHPWQKPWRAGKKPQNRKPAQKAKRNPWAQPVTIFQRPSKSRRVFVTLELETDAKLGVLRAAKNWTTAVMVAPCAMWGRCIQAQANVAQK